MKRIHILDCTLRDGGYINSWKFGRGVIKKIVQGLYSSNLDMIEVGYLNKDVADKNKSIFKTVCEVGAILPNTNEKECIYLAMADVDQFLPENLEPRRMGYIDGIRVVFYKHQIEKAMTMCKAVSGAGYKLFVQPMVTVDYNISEYNQLIDRINELNPYAVSIVDSFGYMGKGDLFKYFQILDTNLNRDILIGFHSHNNMQMALMNAESLFSYRTQRQIIIDSSLYGMGRGAGNLNTELITNYYNETVSYQFNVHKLIELIGAYIFPISLEKKWGYSPYFYLTALYHCHPNYVSYLLSEKNISVSEFEKFIQTIPSDFKTKCKKVSTLELYDEFIKQKI